MKSTRHFLTCLSVLSLGLSTQSRGQVLISEFMADNKKALADQDGVYSDWIEVFNPTTNSVNLAGWALTDDPTHQARWTFPSTNLSANGFLVVFASGTSRTTLGQPLHANFKLSADGEYLALLKPDGTPAWEFAPGFPQQNQDISYGIAQNVVTNTLIGPAAALRVTIPGSGSLGSTWTGTSFNDSSWTSGTAGVGYETAVPGFAVRNYKANVAVNNLAAAEEVIGNQAQQSDVFVENAPVINYVNTGTGANFDNDRTFPGLTINSDVEDFVIDATATITIPAAGSWTFGVNSDDGFSLTIGSFSMSYPDPRGPGDTLQTFNFPAAGEYPLHLIFYERGGGSELELYAAKGSFGGWDSNFRLVGDTASGGLEVRAPVISGGAGSTSYRTFIRTDLQSQMSGVNPSAYLRVPFTVATPSALKSLTLRMMYDDGFIAYINGQEVARRNAPASPQWNSSATASHPNAQAFVFENINISDFLGSLQTGNNILAIQGMNQGAADADFLIVPELVEYEVTGSSTNFFATSTPGAPNGSGFIAFVADTKFSVDHGFFTNAFTVAITTATEGATIRYTTDGSTPSLLNGSTYTTPVTISKTTVLRAAAFKDGFQPANANTKTYIFLADVIRQSPNGETPPGWPAGWGGNTVDYGMDPNVVNNPLYSGTILNDMKTIPSISIATDLGNLFDPSTGIYANPSGDGQAWERPATLELIYPDGSNKGFHVHAGLRIRGGYSRSTGNPKHGFRLFFRQEYGDAKLNYPLFANQNGTDEFNGFDLRTFQNYSWSFEGDSRGIFLRDQFSRDTQIDMGQPGERGDYYHLYIDGEYWGLYNTAERAEASYAASYFGGDKEEYDVVKVDPGLGYNIVATDGNLDAWSRLYQAAVAGFGSNAAYQKVQGNNPDGTRNPNYEVLLDVDNLIDYMLIIFYGGNLDAPISNFLGNGAPNNWFGFRHTNGMSGFRFVAHDSEHTLLDVNENRVGPFPAGDPNIGGGFLKSNPQYIFQQLWDNSEFKTRLADRIQKHFFNGGALSPQAALARFMKRKNEIDRAVVAESARWGDSKREPARTRNNEWITEINRIANSYIPQRTGIVLNQLKAQGLFPTVATPAFNQFGGNVTNGFSVTISAPVGKIYYTRDGSDPRLAGGTVSSTALVYGGPIRLTESAEIKARALSGGVWSALLDATFYVIQDFTDVLVTEIMYHPPDTANTDGDAFEFIELKNVGANPRELSGVQFGGIDFTFPLGTFIAPGQFMVLVSDPVAFASKYPAVHIDGVYKKNLSNSGETVSLLHVTGTPIFSVAYDSEAPWPVVADGSGFSLVPLNPNLNPDPNNPVNWRASTTAGGSPGADDTSPNLLPVYINEALTHTDLPQVDSVELYNPNSSPVNIGNWFLTDSRSAPFKFRIPGGDARATIPAGGYVVFTDDDWAADPGSTNSFRLDSHGEEIYLYSADSAGTLTGFSDGFAFGSSDNGVSFGRYVTSTGEPKYPAQLSNSLGSTNTGPRVGPVVINEIQYNPAVGDVEYVELKNISGVAVKLYDPAYPTNTWKLNGVGFNFPMNTEIPANGIVLLIGGDPGPFRTKYGVPSAVQIFGPFGGALQNDGESVALQRPGTPDLDTNTGAIFIPYIDVDVVDYNNQNPWPIAADGTGASLERLDASKYGNDPINWRSSPGAPSPGIDNTGNRPPLVSAGSDQSLSATNFPTIVALSGSASDDGLPNPPASLSATWTQVSGPGAAKFANVNQPSTSVTLPVAGTYVLRLMATDGEFETASTVTVTVNQATFPVTFVEKGSVWKYLDDGSDPGTAWRAPAFNDSQWKSGPARLGYGGDSEVTTIDYGPDSGSKYITTYFRRAFMVTGAAQVKNLVVNLLRDDGAVVYLNGTELFRDNMPADTVNSTTLALNAVGGTDESNFYPQAADPALLVEGTNVLAVEIHQSNPSSTDVGFDLAFTGEGVPNSAPINEPPVVTAGPDQAITLPAEAELSGSATDDGLPKPPGKLITSWSIVSGRGSVTFSDTNSVHTRATFSGPGTYVLRLTANDGASQSSSDVTITVLQNAAPVVMAGANQTITLPASAQLAGTASDDGLPVLPGNVTTTWSKVSGPDAVTFADVNSASTTASFSSAGTYVLRLTASDGALQSTSDVTITVLGAAAPPHIDSVSIESGATPALRITFTPAVGVAYTVEYSDVLPRRAWTKLTDIAALSSGQPVTVTDSNISNSSKRYYRIVTSTK